MFDLVMAVVAVGILPGTVAFVFRGCRFFFGSFEGTGH
jgi:hypothetical protein